MLAYGGGWLDRAAALRADREWMTARLADPAGVLLPLWRDHCLVDAGQAPVRLALADAADLLAAADEPVFLGLDDDVPVFAVDLSQRSGVEAVRLAGAVSTVDVRALVGRLAPADAAVQAYARGCCTGTGSSATAAAAGRRRCPATVGTYAPARGHAAVG